MGSSSAAAEEEEDGEEEQEETQVETPQKNSTGGFILRAHQRFADDRGGRMPF